MDVALTRIADAATLGAEWRALEERADASFFQSWTWLGCRVRERFPDPVVLRATAGPRTVALGLFNRTEDGRLLALGETGDPVRDAVYVEHNGLLIERGWPPGLAVTLLRHALRLGAEGRISGVRLRLSGIPAGFADRIAAAGLRILRQERRPAWIADLAMARRDGSSHLDRRGRNTRHAIRRSGREFADGGELRLVRATTLAEAHRFLAELRQLHEAHWHARGRPGAFADPFAIRFHAELIGTGLPRDEIDLLRVTGPSGTIGVLYNFRHRGQVLAYQGGFAYRPGAPRAKPGITSHALAIAAYERAGLCHYDFLAGDAEYKRQLSDRPEPLAWCEVA